MRYLRRTLNYLGRIIVSNITHLMSMPDPMAIDVETPGINSRHSLEKEFIELIHRILK